MCVYCVYKMTAKHSSPSITKFLNSHSQRNCLSYSLFFVAGISLGIVCTWYLQAFPTSFQGTPISLSFSWLSPSPLPQPTLQSSFPTLNASSPHDELKENPSSLFHNMDEKELFWKASMVPKIGSYPFNYTPKVAFMFLARGPIPLAPLWEKFFKGYQGLYSIYVHSHPLFNETAPQDSVFHGRSIPSKAVDWGTTSMLDAEKRLVANALLDFSNERFVLLSEACIPLFNFTTVYNYLIDANRSFLSLYDDPRKAGRGRYNKQMWPTISMADWRKGSQWFELHRSLAIEVVSDTKYYPIFQEYCAMPCYPDEHYIPTLVNMISPEVNSNRSITWVDWSRGGPHPGRFLGKDITVEFIEWMRHGAGSNCTYNGNETSICFLFARKFLPNTLGPLLEVAPKLLAFDL